jgi:hypothetical protein
MERGFEAFQHIQHGGLLERPSGMYLYVVPEASIGVSAEYTQVCTGSGTWSGSSQQLACQSWLVSGLFVCMYWEARAVSRQPALLRDAPAAVASPVVKLLVCSCVCDAVLLCCWCSQGLAQQSQAQ